MDWCNTIPYNGYADEGALPIEVLLMPAWRAILLAIADGSLSVEQGKGLMKWMAMKE